MIDARDAREAAKSSGDGRERLVSQINEQPNSLDLTFRTEQPKRLDRTFRIVRNARAGGHVGKGKNRGAKCALCRVPSVAILPAGLGQVIVVEVLAISRACA